MKLGSVAVSIGQQVRAGAQIGLVGSSGMSGGPHLHFNSLFNNVIYEPYAGPARSGASNWVNQAKVTTSLHVTDATVVVGDAGEPAGSVVADPVAQGVGLRFGLGDLPPHSTIGLRYFRPDGTQLFAGNFDSGNDRVWGGSGWWAYYILTFDTVGTWHIVLEINAQALVTMPFDVVGTGSQIVNRPPNAVTIAFDPPAPTPSDVVFCRIQDSPGLRDKDYDLVRYHYVWSVNGSVVRDVVSPAMSDAVARDTATFGDLLKCAVTPMDFQDPGATTIVQRPLGYTVGGLVRRAGAPFAGVQLTAGTRSATTGADGTYLIDGLAPGTYAVTPSGGGFAFTPASRSTTVGPDKSGVNFDVDPPTLALSAATYDVAEGGTVNVEVTRIGDTAGTVSTKYSVSNSTATAGDYQAASGTLSFGPGQASKTFTVTTNVDALLEGPETVNLALSSPAGAVLGRSSAILTIADDPAPPTPAGLTPAVSGPHSVLISFTDRCANETRFVLERALSGGVFGTLATLAAKTGTGGTVSYTDGSVTPGSTYFYRVRAENSVGVSDRSANAGVTVAAPAAPVLSSVTVLSARQVKVAWQDKSTNELNFRVEAMPAGGVFAVVATPPANAVTVSPAGLTPDKDYTFRVLAQNGANSTASNTITAHTFAPPKPPVNLAAERLSGSQIRLTWAFGDPHSDFWQIERSSDGSSFSLLTRLDKSILHYTDAGLPTGSTRYYRLAAISGTALSSPSLYAVGSPSGVVSTTTLRQPNPPQGLAAQPLSASQIRLSWQSGDPITDAFRIERKSGAGWVIVSDVGKAVLFYTVNGLPPGQSFTFRVSAIAGTNLTGPQWYVLSAPAGPVTAATLAAPAAPTGLTATAQPGKQVLLAWSENAATETGYRVERSSNGGSFAEIAQLAGNAAGYRDTGVTAGVTYAYRVRAVSGTWFSAYSNTRSATAIP